MEKVSFSLSPKAKVSCLWNPGTSRVQFWFLKGQKKLIATLEDFVTSVIMQAGKFLIGDYFRQTYCLRMIRGATENGYF